MTIAAGFLRHNDSLQNLANMLEEHHDDHNKALDVLGNKMKVGELASVGIGVELSSSDASSSSSDNDELEDEEIEREMKTALKKKAEPVPEAETSQENIQEPSKTPVDAAVDAVLDDAATTTAAVSDNNNAVLTIAEKTSTKNNSGTTENKNDLYGDYYAFDPYAPTTVLQSKQSEFNLLTCLFPWLRSRKADHQSDETNSSTQTPDRLAEIEDVTEAQQRKQPDDALAAKTDTNNVQKGATEKQDLNSVRDVKPEQTLPLALPAAEEENQVSREKPNPVRRGILKKTETKRIDLESPTKKKKAGDTPSGRRALFDTLYDGSQGNAATAANGDSSCQKKVEFSPMARVVAIDSHKAMNPTEKNGTWWARRDYDDFKKSSRFVTQAIMQPGSEVWMMTNPSWGHNDNYNSQEEKLDDGDGQKWWRRWGHSRRGLEHLTSPKEGQERHDNVRQSIRAVLKEQKWQKGTLGHSTLDDERIRKTYIRYNSWARELCLAAGACDAEAVRANFHSTAPSRDYYIAERGQTIENTTTGTVPDFMKQKQRQFQVSVTLSNSIPEAIHDEPILKSTGEKLSKKAVGFGARND